MKQGYQKLRDGIFNHPLALLAVTDKKLLAIADGYMPYSTGIEIECRSEHIVLEEGTYRTLNMEKHNAIFEAIPDIMRVNCDYSEQRYRIPAGIKGMICLYRICEKLKEHSILNPQSGIHYHIDFTNHFDDMMNVKSRDSNFIRKNSEWMIQSLKSWNYKGRFNDSKVLGERKDSWIRYATDFKTLEFRIGEMSFDYSLIIKRIIHAQSLVRKFAHIVQAEKRKWAGIDANITRAKEASRRRAIGSTRVRRGARRTSVLSSPYSHI